MKNTTASSDLMNAAELLSNQGSSYIVRRVLDNE